jgi:raffinose/stachyose/melibiose transport system permease protein
MESFQSKVKPIRFQSKFRKSWRNHYYAFLFLFPAMLSICFFKYYPFVNALEKSFFNWNGANLKDFVGLRNYLELLQDPIFWTSIQNIMIITCSAVIIQLIFPLIAAICVFHIGVKWFQNLSRVLFIIPLVVPGVIIFQIWRWIYAGDYGILNGFLSAIGLESWQQDWLGSSSSALPSLIFINFPWAGTIAFLIYLGGLVSISRELFESGQMDGMNFWQQIRHIEIPLLKSQIRLVIILTIVQQFQSFENVLILTNGGPGYSTITPALYLYKRGFDYNELGYASAIGVSMFIVIIAISIISNKYLKQTDKID